MKGSEVLAFIQDCTEDELRTQFKFLPRNTATIIVRRALGEWDLEDKKPTALLRVVATKLSMLTTQDDVLSHLHPGDCVVYRGATQFVSNTLCSWTLSKKRAASFGAPVVTRKIFKRTDYALMMDVVKNAKVEEILAFGS